MNLENAQKILLVAPHRLGDTLFATPGIRVLRQAKPESKIDAITLSSLSFETLKNNTCLNKVYHSSQESIEKLALDYDLILPLQNIKKIQIYLKNIPNVMMLPRYTGSFHYSQNFYRFILQHLPNASTFSLGGYELSFTDEDERVADSLLTLPKKSFLLAVQMGCHTIAKRQNSFFKLFPFLVTRDSRSWPFKYFDKLFQRLLKNYPDIYIVLTGSANERFSADALDAHSHILNLMGNTNVTQLAALLKRCQLLLTGDTGPMHVASAVDLPIVLLCGKTNPLETGPYPKKNHHTIIQKKGMKNISVDEVYETIVQYIQKGNPRA